MASTARKISRERSERRGEAEGRAENGIDPREAGPKPPFPGKTQPSPGVEAEMEPRPDYGERSYVGHERLEGRAALVTGADSGIGRAVALAFAREGADVGIAYLSERTDAEETRRVVEDAGRKAVLFEGDLADRATCEAIVGRAVSAFGRIDVLVNNAAVQGESVERFEDIDPDRLERTFRVNVMAMFHLVRAALPHMKPGSAIINVASIQAYMPSPDILDYATTKGAIVTFTKGLAKQLADRGIRVNCVAPGPVWTPLIQQSFDADKVSKFGEQYPLHRPAQPVEIAPAFVFLASNESLYVSGEVLGITGGRPLP